MKLYESILGVRYPGSSGWSNTSATIRKYQTTRRLNTETQKYANAATQTTPAPGSSPNHASPWAGAQFFIKNEFNHPTTRGIRRPQTARVNTSLSAAGITRVPWVRPAVDFRRIPAARPDSRGARDPPRARRKNTPGTNGMM